MIICIWPQDQHLTSNLILLKMLVIFVQNLRFVSLRSLSPAQISVILFWGAEITASVLLPDLREDDIITNTTTRIMIADFQTRT